MAKLTEEQIRRAKARGVSLEQIEKYQKEALGVPEKVFKKKEKAEKFLKKPWYGQLFTKEFGKSFVKTMGKATLGPLKSLFYKTPAKVATSLLELPKTLITGKATQKEWKLPGLAPFKSYLSEEEEKGKRIVEEAIGEREVPKIPFTKIGIPWQVRALIPFVEVPLDVINTVIIAKGIVKGITKIPKVFSTTKKAIAETGRAKEVKRILQALQPKRTPTEIKSLTKAGKLTTTGKGLWKKTTMKPSTKDIEVANDVLDLVNPKKGLSQNIDDLDNAILNVSQQTEKFLQDNPKKIYKGVLEKQLDKIKPKEWIKSEKSVENSYKYAKDWIIRQLKAKGEMTNTDLWDFRKELDFNFEKQFGARAWDFEKATAAREAYHQCRRLINDFIVKGTQATGDFANNMKLLHHIYTAIDNLSTWAPATYGKTGWQLFWKAHPYLRKGLKTGAIIGGGATGLGWGLRGLFKE